MIIKGSRYAAASGPRNLLRHVLEKDQDNDSIETICGSGEEVQDIFAAAQERGDRYAVRHVVLSPAEPMTRDQAMDAARAYVREFGGQDSDLDHALVVEHAKGRADGVSHDRHWHVIIPERLPSSDRVMDSRHMYARHEKLARLIEAEHGHAVTKGRHNRAVIRALQEAGNGTAVASLTAAGIAEGEAPQSAYSGERHQIAKRQGFNLPALRQAVKDAWRTSDGPQAFAAALAEHGLAVQAGAKAGVWIVVAVNDGKLVGSVDRLAAAKRAEVNARMAGHAPAVAHVKPVAHGRDRRQTYEHYRRHGEARRMRYGINVHELARKIAELILRLFGLSAGYRQSAIRPEDPNTFLPSITHDLKAAVREAMDRHREAELDHRRHQGRRPEGVIASLTGKTKEWERADMKLAAAVEAAAERVHERQAALDRARAEAMPGARSRAARNAAANAADMKLAEGAEAVAHAIKGGDLATAEAALQAFERDPTRPDLADARECATVWRSLQIKPPSDFGPTPTLQPDTAPGPAPRM